jgi:putative DNA primase/helicase
MRDGDTKGRLPPIDFADLNARLMSDAMGWLQQWLPGGKRQGREYTAASTRDGGPGDSLSINVHTGTWSHFAAGKAGGDLLSLKAYLFHNESNKDAALDLMQAWGMHTSRDSASDTTPPTITMQPPPKAEPVRRTTWRPVVPVPGWAPQPTFAHYQREPADIMAVNEYRMDRELHGYVVRFKTSDGGKDDLPHTWCIDESDGAGTQGWRWKQFDEPRPLFVPRQGWHMALPVLVVEGEKCAKAAHTSLGDHYDVVAWPGGGKAWDKAQWHWIAGRDCVLWPDNDSKREALTTDEKRAGVDPEAKPYLPADKQPGAKTMAGLAEHLATQQRCTVRVCRIDQPGVKPDGYDIADAIADGITPGELLLYIGSALPWAPKGDLPQAGAAAGPAPAGGAARGAGQGAKPRAREFWGDCLIHGRYGPLSIRENLVMALDGVPEEGLQGIEAAAGLIAFNEFSNNVTKLRPTPWGTPAGTWWEEDELLMGDWLCRHHSLPSMPRGTLEEAVRMVAFRHRYHPVREQFEALRGQWDGTPRLETWLRTCCLEEDEFDDSAPLQQYLARVGKWLLMAMVGRILTPGVKFDYMVIFEGPQGVGKSSLARVLGGDYYADSPLNIGDKDALQNMQGVAVYEIGELDSMSRSEVTRVKAFISSQTDRFRATFDRRPKDYPRQCVFVGTTNEDHYLTDPTGNRRFWPVRVTRHVDLQWMRDNREQLLAEAVHRLDHGEVFYPSPEEQRSLFEPQQQQRAVENAIESAIGRYLHDEQQRVPMGGDNGTLLNEVTLVELLHKVGIGIEKLGPGRFHEKQAAGALRKLGWVEGRSSKPGRPRVYRRPAQPMSNDSSTRQDAGASTSEPHESIPF